jgi:hypothetical protein
MYCWLGEHNEDVNHFSVLASVLMGVFFDVALDCLWLNEKCGSVRMDNFQRK